MSTTPIILTAAMLRDLDACESQCDTFAELFPEGIALTAEPDEETVKQIAAARLDVDWVADALLTADALVAYGMATKPADAAYLEAIEPTHSAHQQAITNARAACREITTDTLNAYRDAIRAAEIDYCEAAAPILWRLLADPTSWRADLLERAA